MPAITKPNLHFDASLYTGTGSSLTVTNSGSMQPDLVWVKSRSTGSTNHLLEDVIRGTKTSLISNGTNTELARGINAFLSNGFSFNDDAGGDGNVSGQTYVGWQWKAGGTAVNNTVGSITSQVSANPTAGFSIVTYTGTGSNATIGHGLGVAPKFIIVKDRDRVTDWPVMAQAANSGAGHLGWIRLNLSNAWSSTSILWNDTAPTSSVFSIGTYDYVNEPSSRYVAYCFAEVSGYSAFGSYTGNGSANGPFVYLGFRPAFIMIKRANSGDSWFMYDNKRETFNPNDSYINANTTNAEDTNNNTIPIDFVSNGFKNRGTSTGINGSGSTYIYMAFAEAPFKYANAE